MSFDLELTDRRAVVTGGTKGIGAAVVAVLRDVGVRVITTARSAPKASPEGVHFVAADLSTADGCAALADGRGTVWRDGHHRQCPGRIERTGGWLCRPRRR